MGFLLTCIMSHLKYINKQFLNCSVLISNEVNIHRHNPHQL